MFAKILHPVCFKRFHHCGHANNNKPQKASKSVWLEVICALSLGHVFPSGGCLHTMETMGNCPSMLPEFPLHGQQIFQDRCPVFCWQGQYTYARILLLFSKVFQSPLKRALHAHHRAVEKGYLV